MEVPAASMTIPPNSASRNETRRTALIKATNREKIGE
jgi:hypothetical protein